MPTAHNPPVLLLFGAALPEGAVEASTEDVGEEVFEST